jgi:hypothetical protein
MASSAINRTGNVVLPTCILNALSHKLPFCPCRRVVTPTVPFTQWKIMQTIWSAATAVQWIDQVDNSHVSAITSFAFYIGHSQMVHFQSHRNTAVIKIRVADRPTLSRSEYPLLLPIRPSFHHTQSYRRDFYRKLPMPPQSHTLWHHSHTK